MQMSAQRLGAGVALLVASVCAEQAHADTPPGLANYSFDTYLYEFGKAYPRMEELARRRAIFEANLIKMHKHNTEYALGVHSWWMAPNYISDWTDAEFRSLRSTHRSVTGTRVSQNVGASEVAFSNPDRIDWREHNVVTPVNDQHSCGSCWAFSAAETLESHHAIATGKLIQLSPQALVNCVQNPSDCGGSGGCKGATMELAFNFTKEKGLPLSTDVPYINRGAACGAFTPAVQSTGYVKLPPNNAAALETAVATKGPISVIVAALPWQLYGGGIFAGCSQPLPSLGNELDHGVQLVGYGSDKGQRYWLVRNSWGSWGEKGYIRITRNNDDKTFTDDDPRDGVACKPYPKTQTVGGECGILFDTSYPTGVSSADGAVMV